MVKKIIASTFIPELPRIDFNGFEEEFGIVSYHKLYNEDIKKRLLNSDTIVFHSFDESNFKDFKEKIPVITAKKDITFNEVFANKNGEKLYLVSLK